MTTQALKFELIDYLLRTNDEHLLNRIAALVRAEGTGDEIPTDEDYAMVKERYEAYTRGEGKVYTWEEAKAMIRSGKGREA